MKRFIIVALALMMVAALCAGCRRSRKEEPVATTTTAPTTPMATTTMPTTPMMTTPTDPMMPNDSIGDGNEPDINDGDMLPGETDHSNPGSRGRMRRIG